MQIQSHITLLRFHVGSAVTWLVYVQHCYVAAIIGQTTPNSAVRPISTVKSFDLPMQNLDSVCYVVGRCIYWKVCTVLCLKGHKLCVLSALGYNSVPP